MTQPTKEDILTGKPINTYGQSLPLGYDLLTITLFVLISVKAVTISIKAHIA